MELSSFFDMIAQYGWSSILIALGIGFVYIAFKFIGNKIADNVRDGMESIADRLSKNISNQNETLSSNITKQNGELVKAISSQNERLLSYIMNKDIVSADIHDAQVEKRIEIAESIIDKLKEVMNKCRAQRAFIIEFHNSYKNLAGSPFAKYTSTFEWFDKGLEQISTRISGLPYSTMAKIVGDVKRTGKHQKLYTDIKKMEEQNPQLFSLVKDERTKAIFYNTLYDDNNKMMGMLVLEWQIPFHNELFEEANMPNIIAQDAAQLSMWINLQGPSIESVELDTEQ